MQSNERHRTPDPHWQPDLTSNRGINQGFLGNADQEPGKTAHDDKVVDELLRDWSDDDLKQITVVGQGRMLEQGATYLDLLHPERGEFTAYGGEIAEPDQRIVAKSATDYELWNRLLEWAAHR
jgi:hypothetical protein